MQKFENKYILEKFSDLNWVVIGQQEILSINDFKRKIDYIIKINGKKYVAEVKTTRDINNIISTIFYRVYAHLNELCEKNKFNPLAIFIVDNIEKQSFIERLDNKFKTYAQNFSWLIICKTGGYAYRFYKKTKITYLNMKYSTKNSFQESTNNLSFSDLELWMLKILFYYNHKIKSNIVSTNKSYIENAYQLSKISNVSQRTSNNWINKMKRMGYISDDNSRYLKIINLERLLNLWSGRYNIKDNYSIRYFSYIQTVSNVETKVIDTIKKNARTNSKFMITGHFGAEIYNLRISNADSLHIYSLVSDSREIEEKLNLVETENKSNIKIMVPKFHESLSRMQAIMNKKYVVDLIQLYLDCKGLHDRGYEQSEEIKKYLLQNYE